MLIKFTHLTLKKKKTNARIEFTAMQMMMEGNMGIVVL